MYYIKYEYGGLDWEDKRIEYQTYQEAYDIAIIKQKVFNDNGTYHKLNFRIFKNK